MDATEERSIAVIGGGITGLATAYYASRMLKEAGIQASVTLVERSERLGGTIHTIRQDGFAIEKGPDSFLSRKLPILELTRELDFEDELVPLDPANRKSYILHRGKLHRIPAGMVIGVPTEWTPFVKTGLISPAGKLRAAMDLLLPKRKEEGDESLGDFLQRRLGREVLNHIAEPLLGGIYAGDVHKLSMQATFPQYQQLEQKYRSIIAGMKASRGKSDGGAALPDIARQSAFLSYRRGLESLVDRLKERMEGVTIGLGYEVDRIEKEGQGYRIYGNEKGVKSSFFVDAVVVTLPAYAVTKLMPDVEELQSLQAIPYVSVSNVVLVYDKSRLEHPLDGSGFVIPRTEGRFITACTWTSSKWMHVAPEGKAVIRCYVGRAGETAWMQMSDEELVRRVKGELRDLMGIETEPLFTEVTRLMNAMPQYPVGHLDNLRSLRAALAVKRPGTYLAGGGYEGVGLPDCIRQGKEAAKQAIQYVSERHAEGAEAVHA